MKVLVVLSAVLAGCLASPNIGYGYSAVSPLTGYGSFVAPYSYAYSAPIISAAHIAAPYSAPYSAPIAAPIAPIAPVAPLAAPVKTQYHSQDEAGQASYGHSEPHQAHHAVQDAHGNKIGSFSYIDPHGAVHRTDYVADSEGYRVTANDLPVAPAAPLPALHRRRRQAWNGPAANVVVTPTGHLADTPEVSAVKAAHLAEHAKQNSGAQAAPSWNQGQQPWNQQPAARSWNQPQAPAQSWSQPQSWNQPQAPSWNQPQAQSWNQAPAAARSWTQPQPQPQAAPSWSQAPTASWGQPAVPNSPIADAPDVAAAKAAHLSEHARVASAAQSASSTNGRASDAWETHDGQYHEPAQNWDQGAQSWNQPQATQSWSQPQVARSWTETQAAQSWSQPQAAPAQSWNQPAQSWNQGRSWEQPASNWNQGSSWNQSPSGGIPDTPEVAAAKAAHFAEVAAASRRTKRSVFFQTPASTAPLAAPLVPAPLPYAAPALGVPAIHTEIVHNPGHAQSYRVDPIAHY